MLSLSFAGEPDFHQRLGSTIDAIILRKGCKTEGVLVPSAYNSWCSAPLLQVCGLKWAPNDRELASGGNDNQLYVWHPGHATTPVLRFSDHSAAVKAIAWSPHQHGLLVSGGGTADRCIRFWNTTTAAALNCIDTGELLNGVLWMLHLQSRFFICCFPSHDHC